MTDGCVHLLYNSRWKFHQLAAGQLLGKLVRYEKGRRYGPSIAYKITPPGCTAHFSVDSGPELEEDALAIQIQRRHYIVFLLRQFLLLLLLWSFPGNFVLFDHLLFFYLREVTSAVINSLYCNTFWVLWFLQLTVLYFLYSEHACLRTIPPFLIRSEAEYF
jgi:hypothetical protein